MQRSNPANELREVQQLNYPNLTRSATPHTLPALIERMSTWLFVGVALLYLISFNGQWRIGLDSANYRGLADSIVSGRGYVFGEWAGKNITLAIRSCSPGCRSCSARARSSPAW
jgi:hypothetical protein